MRFWVRLTPKGGRDRLEGWAQGADGKTYLRARVSEPPEDGKANAALLHLLAKAMGVGQSKLRIVSGATGRLKMIEAQADEALLKRLGNNE